MILDTHAWLWYYLGDVRLSQRARAMIEAPSQVKYISPASYWELAIKVSAGKYVLNETFADLIQHSIIDNGFRILSIDPRHAVQVAALPYTPEHKDPFDRLLVSQALVEGIPIVSGDEALDAYGVTRLW